MKRFSFLLTMVLLCAVTFAQSSKRTTAYNYLRNGKLDKALENIEPCITNEKTMNEPKTWFYRGNIYLQIALDTSEYKKLAKNGYQTAYESYKKALTLEGANEFKVDIYSNMGLIADGMLYYGVGKYNENDFAGAYELFVGAGDVRTEVGVFDSVAYYYAGKSAELAKNYENAKVMLTKVMESGYKKPDIYASLSSVYKEMKDTVMAFKVIQAGRALYPNDLQVLFAETNLYLAKGESAKALANLEMAKKLDPSNPTIFFAVGAQYDNAGNVDEAEKAYLTALELKPDYFDAIYNLGALHVNNAAKQMTDANAIPPDKEKEYLAMKAKADASLDKALPYLEKAHAMDPADKNTIRSLKEIYARKSMMDKVKEMDEKLK